VGAGVAFTAWTLGARHAFDADHISAIDNVTRKLMSEGKRPFGTGFFFALGHSTIVVVVGMGISVAARSVFRAVVDPTSTYETLGGMLGTLVSASFLYLIAILNVVVLAGIAKVLCGLRRNLYTEEDLERQLQARGLMWCFFGRFMRSINHSPQMFFVGLVFGIGFDTATEVLLLTATAFAATEGLPFYAVLAPPLLFSAGMTLFDTLDGGFMNVAYGWAFACPVREVYYNLVIAGLSIAAAFLIGTLEILGALTTELHLRGAAWRFLANFNINRAGYGTRYKTVLEHRATAMAHAGYRSADAGDLKRLGDWLTERALEHDRGRLLLELALGWLREERVVRPGLSVWSGQWWQHVDEPWTSWQGACRRSLPSPRKPSTPCSWWTPRSLRPG
jgi:high-affinity nickel-transport protein